MRTYKLKHANEPTPQLLLIISIILSLNSHTFSHESQKSDTLLPCKSCIYNKLRQQHTLTTTIKPTNHQPLNKYSQSQISTGTNKLTILSPIDTIQIWISNTTQPRISRNFRISQEQKINTFQSFRQHNANNVLNHTGTNFHSLFPFDVIYKPNHNIMILKHLHHTNQYKAQLANFTLFTLHHTSISIKQIFITQNTFPKKLTLLHVNYSYTNHLNNQHTIEQTHKGLSSNLITNSQIPQHVAFLIPAPSQLCFEIVIQDTHVQEMLQNREDLSDVSDSSLPGSPSKVHTMTTHETITFSATKADILSKTSSYRSVDGNNTKRTIDLTPPTTEKKNKLEHFKPVNAHKLWYGFHTMEARAIELGIEACEHKHQTADELAQDFGISKQEATEFLHVRHAFPHVEQKAYPLEREDGRT